MNRCPDESKLRAFNNGLVQCDLAIDEIGEHLEVCPECQRKVSEMTPCDLESEFRHLFHAIADAEVSGDADFDVDLSHAEELSRIVLENIRLGDHSTENRAAKYRLNAHLGTGHFFHCLRAVDVVQAVDVAIKSPVAGRLVSVDHWLQFQRDATAAMRLEHPNIVRTVDHGMWNDKRWFIATELIDGIPLLDWIASDPDDESRTRVLGQILDAIDFAHRSGTIHRHLDERNILIDRDNNVRITDFGFAMDTRYQSGIFENHIRRNDFHAPELFHTKTDACDERSDIWSLGVIAAQLLVMHFPNDPLEQILARCQHQSRSQRFQTVPELRSALRKSTTC